MKSMTGFGSAEKVIGSSHFSLEIKSVNHRFLDIRFRLPPVASGFESEINEQVRSFCERGSLDISLRQKLTPQKGRVTGNTRFAVDEGALDSFLKAVQQLEKRTKSKLPYTLNSLLDTGRVLVPFEESDEALFTMKEFQPLFTLALKNLVKMREKEGKNLEKVMRGIITEMRDALKEIESFSKSQSSKIKEKLENRLKQWQLSAPVEPRRLEWEIALLAEKSDITEEIDRLKAHFEAFLESFDSQASIGRKLDFLTQELNREVNTIASKTTLMEITQLTVRLKSNIEKLREQVQNVE